MYQKSVTDGNIYVRPAISDACQQMITGGRSFYRPELDALRFLAFLLVYIHHILIGNNETSIAAFCRRATPFFFGLQHASRFGLSLFFTLSAYLICELLLRERIATGTVAVKKFYFRRILRIWPLYYFGLTLGLIFAFLPGVGMSTVHELGWFALFMGAWHITGFSNPATPLWSVSVEEWFYLFAPFIAKYCKRKAMYIFCITIILVANSVLYLCGSNREFGHASGIWYNPFAQFECFAM